MPRKKRLIVELSYSPNVDGSERLEMVLKKGMCAREDIVAACSYMLSHLCTTSQDGYEKCAESVIANAMQFRHEGV